MPTLTLDEVPVVEPVFEVVELAEFGEAEDGSFYSVNVRGMTVAEWDWMLFHAFDRSLESPNGDGPKVELREDYNEICIVAAVCSFDDEGRLVFGVDRNAAVAYLRGLPHEYRPALARIHGKALRLSSYSGKEEDDVAAAEKKS